MAKERKKPLSTDPETGVTRYLHCVECVRQKPDGQSMAMWARPQIGLLPNGDIRVWCGRHNQIVTDIPADLEIVEETLGN